MVVFQNCHTGQLTHVAKPTPEKVPGAHALHEVGVKYAEPAAHGTHAVESHTLGDEQGVHADDIGALYEPPAQGSQLVCATLAYVSAAH